MFSKNVGLAFGANPSREFYMLEIHYDNPMKQESIQFKTGLNIFYTQTRLEFET